MMQQLGDRHPLVDVIIAVHSRTRPIARAVASIVDGTRADVRVSVVAHNIDPDVIAANLGDLARHERVRLLALSDGIHSPAGPMNYGIAHAVAPFISIVGSDDELEAGAIDSWLRLQHRTRASVVIARIAIPGRGTDPYPPVRWGRRTRGLQAARDRLSYRSAPLGLIDRGRYGDLRFTEGLRSGEDIAYSATLWFSGDRIAYDLTGPAYAIREDADDRVTFQPRPIPEDFAFLDALEHTDWFSSLSHRDRQALAVKILRVHVFDAIAARIDLDEPFDHSATAVARVVAQIEQWSPGVVRLLSRADRRVLDGLGPMAPNVDELRRALRQRWAYRTVDAVTPRNLALTFHAQAPFRTLLAGMIASRSR